MTKFIFVTGGVVSGLGKGITAAALGRLLKMRGLKVMAQKLDPYMNIDPGIMDPLEHGEVFVTDDGTETDLDLGHYERFIDEDLTKYSSLTSGKVYWSVLNKEREGAYGGKTVQVIPHITTEIKKFIYSCAKTSGADVLITEIGGTVGDIESQPFLEAVRQIAQEKGRKNCLFIHVALVPYLAWSDEHKSKPVQHSVKELQSLGITPNIIVARVDKSIEEGAMAKIALFCNVKRDCVVENMTMSCIYETPIMLHENGLDRVVCRELGLKTPEPDLSSWKEMLDKINSRDKKVKIALIGKYVRLHDAYLSVIEALSHAGYYYGASADISWIDSETITNQSDAREKLSDMAGIIVPGGSGYKGTEGKIEACHFARENNIPLFGIGLGMQTAVIEFARNVLNISDATSGEFKTKFKSKIIDTDHEGGARRRIGSYPCEIKAGTLMRRAYGKDTVAERHSHRYELNNDYREALENAGLKVSGTLQGGNLAEAVELPENDFFLGVLFHPEFKSRPNKPHPLFSEFIKAALDNK